MTSITSEIINQNKQIQYNDNYYDLNKMLAKQDNVKINGIDQHLDKIDDNLLVKFLIDYDTDNISKNGDDTSGDIFSISETDITKFMERYEIDKEYRDALEAIINEKKEAERQRFLGGDSTEQTQILLDFDKRYGKNIVGGDQDDIQGFLNKWGFKDEDRTKAGNVINHGDVDIMTLLTENNKLTQEYNNIASGTFEFQKYTSFKDNLINKNDVSSEDIKNYLIKKLGLNLEFLEHNEYLKNVQNFIAEIVGDNTLNTENFVMLLANDEGIITSHSIQELAKIGGYVAPEGIGTEVLDRPEFIEDGIDQQNLGNCWFLSGIGAINNSKAGRALIDKAVQENKDGSYTITFPAYPNNTYTISAQQVASAQSSLTSNAYDEETWNLPLDTQNNNPALVSNPTKDKTLIALNLAAEALMNDTQWRDTERGVGLDGGSTTQVAQLFGINTEVILKNNDNTDYNKIKNYLIDNPNAPNISFSANPETSKISNNNPNDSNYDGAIETINNGSGHEFYVESYDKTTDKITYINPWNSSIKYETSFDNFIKYTNSAIMIDIPKETT